MSNYGSGLGAGMASGLVMGMAIKNEAENKARRKSHLGEDQILLKSKRNEMELKKDISNIFINSYLKDGKIMQKESWFDAFTFVISIICIALVWFFIGVYWDIHNGYYSNNSFPIGFFWIIISTVGLSLLCCKIFNRDVEIDYIKISDEGKGRIIQLEVYDSSGYRNLDSLDIMKIEKIANNTYYKSNAKQENKV